MKKDNKMEEIVSLCKRRGFIWQGSEIYGGLAGTWDYGPLGVELKRKLTELWWRTFVTDRTDMYGLDSAILMNPQVWVASRHVDTFNDPLIEDTKTKKRYRLDHLLEDAGVENAASLDLEEMIALIKEKKITSPDGNELGNPAKFNMLFKTSAGAVEDEKSTVYLRGETAQGMFVNFKNVVDSFSPNLPFGIAQIGRTFRNEISPRDFIFRAREFEIMELEYFIDPQNWQEEFDRWLEKSDAWFKSLGLSLEKIHRLEVPAADRAHYSQRTVDFEFEYPFGTKEIAGLAYRTDFDLSQHEKCSGKNLKYAPKNGGEPFIPHVIEPTYGLDRHVLAVLANAYATDTVNDKQRTFLRLPENLAPYRFAVAPLLKNKPELITKAQEVFGETTQKYGNVLWDDNGNIGKRYRRADEIGVPKYIVVDFTTLEDDTVTVRDRDTTEQKRVKISDLYQGVR